MDLLTEVRSISERKQEEFKDILATKLPNIIELIDKELFKEAERGYRSFNFVVRHLDAYTEDQELRTFGYNAEQTTRRALLKHLSAHYRKIGFKTGGNWEVDATEMTIRWDK